MATAKKRGNKYRVRVRDYSLQDGKQWKSFTADSKPQAEAMASAYLTERREQKNPNNWTIGEAIDIYIDSRSNILSPSTASLYRTLRRTAFLPIIDIKLKDIRRDQVQACINAYAANRAPKTVKNAEAFLSTVISTYGNANDVKDIDLPRRDAKEMVIPTEAQYKELLDHTKGTDLYLPILLAGSLGLRRGEICALTWDDIDLENKVITINKSVVLDEFGTYVEKAPKTSKSIRKLSLPKIVEDALPDKSQPLIALRPHIVTSRFNRLVKSLGYNFTFHALRHFNASVMLKLNIPDKYAMERMGHATNNMLKRVYQHTFSEEQQNVNVKVDSFFDALGDIEKEDGE